MTKEVLMSLMLIFILLYAALVPAAHSEVPAKEQAWAERMQFQIIDVARAKADVIIVEAQSKANLERAKAGVITEKAKMDALCGAAYTIYPRLYEEYCK